MSDTGTTTGTSGGRSADGHARPEPLAEEESADRVGAALVDAALDSGADTLARLPEDDLDEIAASVSDQVEGFLVTVREVAEQGRPELGVSHLLLGLSQLLFAGGRLGALADIVPEERFEPDPGDDPDADGLRERLALTLGSSDEYIEIFDPYDAGSELVTMRISDDLAHVATQLAHGLQHARAGRYREALWWWQFSYLSSWGSTASATLRALVSLVAHDRFDVRGPTAVDAEDELLAELAENAIGETARPR